MTMNFDEQKLDLIWSNFGIGHLVQTFLEQRAKIQARHTNFWTATTT
jgi:hypothetical protein